MRDPIVIEYVSLDGVIQAPDHNGEDRAGGFAHGGWTGPFMDRPPALQRRLLPDAGASLPARAKDRVLAESDR